ncbi:hypothetical protein Kpol_1043p34 [Vanderwaltozyma polyspora DSM 70294]|uniref:RRM domain-containing protein n=1 Tax=Vanderwaltozyma polyspora (strain ATCC 22028 / DSM 70294 / BCRC 21397 / CBS 2163 / NBRC 10782 / NRRL Y-8283 / UCD 57-17) TaxID=436907 RepID=A7TIQ2_VANPO|nr:uncharacterized protein Kpol_1043p34 [Vanderwaltozyma polyspora DSM 70294]EDO17844.1 hypothetical protein Kpol_1043p34 [Vanderwaltozyma polyspora DSM 70294]
MSDKPVESVPATDAEQVVAEPASAPAPAPAPAPATTETTSASAPAEGANEGEAEAEGEDESIVPANAINGGRETSDKILYVGNLDKSINEDILKQYFQVGGPITNVKVINDKNNEANYAFVEYSQHHDASIALKTLNGKQIENNTLKINWAFQSQQNTTSDETFNLFIGDLNVDVDDETLVAAFKDFKSFIQAHVMWDMQTGRSRGYGFVSFSNLDDAQVAMDTMQGSELNGRQLRINWASKRENNSSNNSNRNGGGFNQRRHNNNGPRGNNNGGFRPFNNNMPPPPMGNMAPMGAPPTGPAVLPPVDPQAVDDMIRRAPQRVTTVYIGNIPHFATEADLIPLLQNFGFILDFKHYPEKGNCFIKYDTHEQAAVCIVVLANFPFQGRNLKTGWGKEKSTFMPMPPQDPNGQMPPHMMNEQQLHGEQQQDQGEQEQSQEQSHQ